MLWLPDSLCAFIHPANRTDYNIFSLATIFALVSIVYENLCENISRLAWRTHCQRHRSVSRLLNTAQNLCLYFSLLHWTHILVKLNTQTMRSEESVWLQSRVTSLFETSWVVWLHVIDNHMWTCLKCSPLDLTYWHRSVLSHWRLKSKRLNTRKKYPLVFFRRWCYCSFFIIRGKIIFIVHLIGVTIHFIIICVKKFHNLYLPVEFPIFHLLKNHLILIWHPSTTEYYVTQLSFLSPLWE